MAWGGEQVDGARVQQPAGRRWRVLHDVELAHELLGRVKKRWMREAERAMRGRNQKPRECLLPIPSESWKVYALFNHDLTQIFIGAMSLPMDQMREACRTVGGEIEEWEPNHHEVECVEAVEQFPSERHARRYAHWLTSEGAFEGLEHYAMGLDAALA